MWCEVRDPLRGGGGWGPALTCRDGQLGVDLVHEYLPTGLDHDDLGAASRECGLPRQWGQGLAPAHPPRPRQLWDVSASPRRE